jgi:hypothetical protein
LPSGPEWGTLFRSTPLSGGDRKALAKELTKARAMTRILADRANEKRAAGEALIREADDLACQSWNERMWADGGPIDPSPTIDQAINGGYAWLEIACSHCYNSRSAPTKPRPRTEPMCNLYSMTKNVDAIRRLFKALNSRVGNLPSMPGIFPDYPAPIVRNAPDGREIVAARWGMPSSQRALMDATKKRPRSSKPRVRRSTSRSFSGWSRTAAPPTSAT